jgi:hypothetical protein
VIATPNQHQQRAAGRRSWGSSVRAAVYAPHSIVDNQNQSRGHYRARVIFLARPCHASVLHLPGLRASAFYTICRGDLHRHRRLALPSLERGANLKTLRDLSGARRQFSRRQLHVCQDLADVPEAYHLERLSSCAGFDNQEHSERPFTRVQETFAFGATDYE